MDWIKVLIPILYMFKWMNTEPYVMNGFKKQKKTYTYKTL